MKKIYFLMTLCFLFCTSIEAQTFTFNGINYYVTDVTNNYVGVDVNSGFSGPANITEIVTDNGTDYTVTSIRDSAFQYCSGLTNVTIPDSVIFIGNNAFLGCMGLTNITIPNSITVINESVFSNCTGLTSMTIPDSVTSIGIRAFEQCTSLTNITIPDSVTSIGEYGFHSCSSLTNITIPDSVTSISNSLFGGCDSLTSISIPDSITSIGDFAFSGCSALTSVTISDSATSIGYGAFIDCYALTNITIPLAVTSISGAAFSGCNALTSVTSLNPTPPTVANTNAFSYNTYTNGSLYVPNSSIAAYDAATAWEDFNGATTLSVEQFNEIEVTVYPNPVAEKLYIKLQPNNIITSVTLYNINGQKILESTANTLDTSTLGNGVYFATILTNSGSTTKKIVK